mmetsp:Transcript_24492/g.36015  ORF Transcript_24492/g.36015 Transcript_24492/m.36015 type:complete len:664 (+) Transcript_24492:202-2193(+)|eukprot:CAMPEP_0185040296 /NCGR_PEP_ID=MMETSP1103-20130426/38174_1 /TAXON_ID=36769 /ORGANISM="Paraphysomonas bandaiensis, Strain Caron Lab Isolate" /LENGTH=663 /DNA_ID=CAMNT_0027579533 /DNA_START=139 /DNA_END=2130 /DNA_ORIENTATION=+
MPALPPIERPDNASKAKKKGRKKLAEKRRSMHALKLQSCWRGHRTRKSIADQIATSQVKSAAPDPDNAEEEMLEKFQKISFSDLGRVQFYVDRGVGLPVSCTATRVSVSLLTGDRVPVTGTGGTQSYSDPRSLSSSPDFDLFLTWKVQDLDPRLTILCRIDTLERTSLEPVTVGYAALKLCVDSKDEQPISSNSTDVYLNAGRFKLPLVLGSIPDWCVLTEERIEDLPLMPGAFLEVRLFDAAVETPSKPCFSQKLDRNSDTSVAGLLYSTYDSHAVVAAVAERGWPELPMWDTIGADVEMGRQVEEEDWRMLCPKVRDWMTSVFPEVNSMYHTLDPKYAVRYCDEPGGGVMLGLDLLYNMPFSRLGSKSNRVVGYKTSFRYLRANREPFAGDTSNDPKYVFDDVSRFWDLAASTTRCPVYVDDFKDTSGMDLGPEACVLLIVTQVDIIFESSTSFDLHMPFLDPKRTWWGILPLRLDSPFYAPEGSLLEDKEFDGAFANSGTHQVPLFEGVPPATIIESTDPLSSLLDILKELEPEDSVGCVCCVSSVDTAVKPAEDIVLSKSGASAIVRVVDAKMLRFCNLHIKVDGSITPETSTLNKILTAQSGSKSRKKLFQYDAMKYEAEPSMESLISSVFTNDMNILTDSINSRAETDAQTYVNSLP